MSDLVKVEPFNPGRCPTCGLDLEVQSVDVEIGPMAERIHDGPWPYRWRSIPYPEINFSAQAKCGDGHLYSVRGMASHAEDHGGLLPVLRNIRILSVNLEQWP